MAPIVIEAFQVNNNMSRKSQVQHRSHRERHVVMMLPRERSPPRDTESC